MSDRTEVEDIMVYLKILKWVCLPARTVSQGGQEQGAPPHPPVGWRCGQAPAFLYDTGAKSRIERGGDMQTVIIVIHLMVVATIIGVVRLQTSQGGGLGSGSPPPFFF